MKLLLAICCLNIFCVYSLYANNTNKDINLNVTNALVIDYDSKTVLYNKLGNEKVYPASLTKLMTIYILFHEIKIGNLSLNQKVTVSENAYKKGNVATGGSTLFLEIGQKVTVEDLIKGIIVVSGNDASILVAELISGSEENFVELMNSEAKRIGLQNTHFVNSDGIYNKNHYSTSKDLVLLASKFREEFPEYYSLFSIKSFTYNGIKQYNRNPLLNYYNDNFFIDGLKTGHIDQSKYSLAFSSIKEHSGKNKNHDFKLIGVMIGAPTGHARKMESIKLINWIYNNFTSNKILKKGTFLVNIPILYGFGYAYKIKLNKDIAITLPKSVPLKDVQVKLLHPRYIVQDVKKGDKIAELQVTILNEKDKKYNISYDILSEYNILHNYKFLEVLLLPYGALKKLLSQI